MLARSRAIDLYRKNAKRVLPMDSPDASGELSREFPSPEQAVTWDEFRRSATAALDHISKKERMVLELSFFEGLSHSQIANCVNCPLGTVKSHIRRGLEKLKQQLQRWEP